MDRIQKFRKLIRKTDWSSLQLNQMIWLPEIQVGWYPIIKPVAYNQAYFDKYQVYRSSKMGKQINAFRIDFVNKHYKGEVIDIGVGSCHFVDEREKTFGYDVSAEAIEELSIRKKFRDPYFYRPYAITCWDSLEHIMDCWGLVERVQKYVFISVPTIGNNTSSKHYKTDEHWWYFTRHGLIDAFEEMGFKLLEMSSEETQLGREDITTFAFERVSE